MLPCNTSVHSCRNPLPVPTLAAFPPSTCSPGPSWPMQPRASSLFLPHFPPSGCPPFAALNVSSVPVDSCGYSLLGSVFPPPFLKPLPSTAGLYLRPGPCRSRGGLCIQSLASCPPLLRCLLTQSCSSPSLVVFKCLVVFWAPFCALKRGLCVSTPWQSP